MKLVLTLNAVQQWKKGEREANEISFKVDLVTRYELNFANLWLRGYTRAVNMLGWVDYPLYLL